MHAPSEDSDGEGVVRRATIQAYGETVHTFVERGDYRGIYAPGYEARETVVDPLPPVGLLAFDHSVANVELNRMNFWVEFYEKVLGFHMIQGFTDDDISTEYSALMSKVVSDGVGRIKFPINEPAPGKRRSQVDEYLDFYSGPGLQHIAINTDDIIACGLTSTWIEGVTAPFAMTKAMPGTCSIVGTILFVTSAERSPAAMLVELTTSDTTTAWLGS